MTKPEIITETYVGPERRSTQHVIDFPDRRHLQLVETFESFDEATSQITEEHTSNERPLLSVVGRDLELPAHSEPSDDPAVSTDVIIADSTEIKSKKNEGRTKKILIRSALGAAAVGAAVALATNPFDRLVSDVESAAPWTVGALVGTEALWGAGAALAIGASGMKIGNPLKIKGRFGEISQNLKSSKAVETGVTINTIGALGSAGVVIAGAVEALPPSTWPGAVGIAALDIASTVAVRAPIYRGLHSNEKTAARPTTKVRRAETDDVERLADLDLELFASAYGENVPERDEVRSMLEQRVNNTNGRYMYVAEVDGTIEGFVTAFRTNKSAEEFKSWEESTAGGTLQDKVDPEGKYVYVANMTISRKGSAQKAMDRMLANLFADAIEDGIEYGYFESRMPGFRKWLARHDKLTDDPEQLDKLAHEYANTKRKKDDKPLDWQLRMYQGQGFKLRQLVPNAFSDHDSLNYGAVFTADVPPSEKLKKLAPVRWAISAGLRQAAKNPKVLEKVF